MTHERLEQIRTLNAAKAEGHMDSAVQHVRELIEYIDASAPPAPAKTWDERLKLWFGLTSGISQCGVIVAATTQKEALQFLNRTLLIVSAGRFRSHWSKVGHLEYYRAIATKEGVWMGEAGRTHTQNQKWTRLKLN